MISTRPWRRAVFVFSSFSSITLVFCSAGVAEATIVRFDTTAGSIDVRLFDTATPESVLNFLGYATADRYDGTFIHRSPNTGGNPKFVIQGGGFVLNGSIFSASSLTTPADPFVQNEPGISNLRGTLSYAKGPGVNSATSQWFFNLRDNSILDLPVNNEFTAFGRIVRDGLIVADAISNMSLANASVAQNAPGEDFDEIPVFDVNKVVAQGDIFAEDAVIITSIDQVFFLDEGDYNFDDIVNGADLDVWSADFGSTLLAEADGNGSGRVDGGDFLTWQRTFGQSAALAASQAVPEPASGALAAIAAAALLLRRYRLAATR